MGKLIDADKFRSELDNHYPFTKDEQSKHGMADIAKSTVLFVLNAMPPVDAVPVARGRWIGGAEEARCSVCGRNLLDYVSYTEYCEVYEYPTFCPNCGARMDGKGDGEQA